MHSNLNQGFMPPVESNLDNYLLGALLCANIQLTPTASP
jgi:hypothetical protein